jgi:hypothetical protein
METKFDFGSKVPYYTINTPVTPGATLITVTVNLVPVTTLSTIKVDVGGYSGSAYTNQQRIWEISQRIIHSPCTRPSGG